MADTGSIIDSTLLIVVIVVIVLTIATFLELRYFRSFMKRRQSRMDLPDQAHNALLTSKGIANTLRTSGVVTVSADEMIAEAEAAYRRRMYRVTLDLSEKAKAALKTEKARHDKVGDLSRLQRVRGGASDEPTTKEVLQKEHPPNYMQAKFTLSLAEERIAAAREAGRGTVPAEALLATAKASFDAKDYDEALKLAVKSRRTADGEVIAVEDAKIPVPSQVEIPRPANRACASCGAELLVGDPFCRKCGVKVERPTACGKCGEGLKTDDTFCRKCGTAIP
jgi:ribosomal protein L40E